VEVASNVAVAFVVVVFVTFVVAVAVAVAIEGRRTHGQRGGANSSSETLWN